ncbi:MAG TPA: hypothetical protein ACFYD7_12015 [Candidatus Wujingus californicus]|uniref:hypothetical protein n=1 Tax=Candidatus Wujingus californicus TaxID=3367618 RepID=UPI004025369B
MYQLISKETFFGKNIIPIVAIIGIILIRYYEIFFGGSFLLFEDHVTVSGYSYGNSLGNGWRPDKGLGISFFFGDPGMWHPWSFFSLFEKIASSRIFAYNASYITLHILAAISVYYFIRYTVPTLGRSACFISPFITLFLVFPQRHWMTSLIGSPLLILLLYDYYKHPKIVHFFQLIFLSWFVVFFGTLAGFAEFLWSGLIFSFIYYIYFRGSLFRFVSKYVSLISIVCFVTLFLGAWTFYSFFLEYYIAGYVREKLPIFPQMSILIPDLRGIFNTFNSLILVDLWPVDLELPGIGWCPLPRCYNISVISPLVLIFFLYRRSNTFWEHVMKWFLLVCLIHIACCKIFPAYSEIHRYLSIKSSTILKMPGEIIMILHIGLLAVFIVEIKRGSGIIIGHPWGRKIQKGVAVLLFLIYFCMAMFSIFAILIPGVLPSIVRCIIDIFFPGNLGKYSKQLISAVASFNIEGMQNAMHWYSFLFYLSSALLVSFFISRKWFSCFASKPKTFIAGMLILNGILFSLTVFPLNKKGLIWEQNDHLLPEFKPTDRFYYVNYLLQDNMPEGKEDAVKEFEKMFVNIDGEGPREYFTGYKESPGLTFSAYKSFTQKEVASFVYRIINEDEGAHSLREVTVGSLKSNELLNMAAVNYYYTNRKLISIPEYLSLYAKKKQLYVYKNHSAWPYFYLAENMEIKEKGKHLKDVQRGTAYVSEEDFFPLEQGWGQSTIQLKEFSYGKMVFNYEGDRDNFFVVADAWHPFWKAHIEGKDLPVVKANEIFKGVKLPQGEFDLILYFDTSPYYPGIYLAIFAWIAFVSGWFFVWKYNWNISFFRSNTKDP